MAETSKIILSKIRARAAKQGVADDGKRAQTRRVARWTLVKTRREILSTGEVQEGKGSGSLLYSNQVTGSVFEVREASWTFELNPRCKYYRRSARASRNKGWPSQLCTRLSGFPKMAIWRETSSQNGDVGGCRLRRVILKMTISPETSSKKRDLEKITNFRRA